MDNYLKDIKNVFIEKYKKHNYVDEDGNFVWFNKYGEIKKIRTKEGLIIPVIELDNVDLDDLQNNVTDIISDILQRINSLAFLLKNCKNLSNGIDMQIMNDLFPVGFLNNQ